MTRVRERYHETESPIYLGDSWFEWQNVEYSRKSLYYPGVDFTTPLLTSHEICIDETHPGPPYRSGGPLDIRKVGTDQYEGVQQSLTSGGGFIDRYEGQFITRDNPLGWLAWTNPTSEILDDFQWVDPDILVDGANGWNKAKPTIASANALVSLGELPELPLMLKTTAKNYHHIWKDSGGHRRHFGPTSAADNWLNTCFGWVPFLNDLFTLHDVITNQAAILDQLRRDNMQWKYARRSVRKTENVTLLNSGTDVPGHYPGLSTSYYNSPWGNYRTEMRDSLNVWFVGRFKYYIPELKVDGPANMWEIARIYGLSPSPTAIYELTPWSWLLDWCTNYGNTLENLWAMLDEGVVSKYAYVMAHRLQKVTTEAYSNFKGGPVSTVRSAWCEQKVRVPANPFGFGSNPVDFTTRQWSILGALGISKQRVLSR